ncbi:MAG TPA: PAS domain S-box protein [Chloroflexi bacterium]|nr:PAS domain S-box protein [Chloroflexota bacterium]
MTEGIVLTDRDGYLTFVNPAAAEMLGHVSADLVGLHSTEIVRPEFHPIIEEADKRRERGQADRYELELVCQDGDNLPVLVSGAPVFEEGRFVGTIAVFTDITALKRAEGSLQRRNHELALLNRASEALIATLDLDETLINILEETRHLLGVTACSIWLLDSESGELVCQQATGPKRDLVRGWRLSIGEGIAGWVVAHGESQLISDTRLSQQYSAEVSRTTGLPLLSILAVPLRSKERVIGVLQAIDTEVNRFRSPDLTLMESLAAVAANAIENAQLHRQVQQHAVQLEQRVQERTAQLEAQYARVEAILNSASDGIVVTDGQGDIIQTNPVAQAWLTQALRPGDAAELQNAVRDLSQQTKAKPRRMLELTNLDLELKAAPIAEPGWEGARAVVSISDVSEFKALERMKILFFNNASDELSQPISVIKTYAYLAQQAAPDDPVKRGRYLSQLVEEADHLARLLGEIRQLSHIYAGRLEMAYRSTAIDDLVVAVAAAHRHQAQSSGVTLEHRLARPSPVVALDPDQMTRALHFLLESGIYYTPEGGRVEIYAGQMESEDRQWATVTVSDTAESIPPEDRRHIFQRLFREIEPRSVRVRETGLRLMIVREIVVLHGGEIRVEERPGGGNTFFIRLPIVSAD